LFEALPGRRGDVMKARPAVLPGVDPIEHHHVQVIGPRRHSGSARCRSAGSG
jgi:hypothetical protein